MLGNSYSGGMTSRQDHSKLRIGGKKKPKPVSRKRLAFLPKGAPNGSQTYQQLTSINVRAIARWIEGSDPLTILIQLVQGDKLSLNYEGKPMTVWLQ